MGGCSSKFYLCFALVLNYVQVRVSRKFQYGDWQLGLSFWPVPSSDDIIHGFIRILYKCHVNMNKELPHYTVHLLGLPVQS